MIERPFEQLQFGDVEALVTSGRSEDRTIEFKRELTASDDASKKELLADVSSLANAQGGDLIFGVEELNGVCVAVPGIDVSDADAEILRIESLVRDGLQPRILGVRSTFLRAADESARGVLVVRIPSSFQAPHRVVFKGNGKFFTRHSRGKAEMDVHELREAFIGSDSLVPRLRALHGRLPSLSHIPPLPGPMALLTVAPIGVLRAGRSLDLTTYEQAVLPPFPGGMSWVPTLEGFLAWSVTYEGVSDSQVLTHRQGYVEAIDHIGPVNSNNSWIYAESLSKWIRAIIERSIHQLEAQGISGPWVAMFSLADVGGYGLQIGDIHHTPTPIARERFDFQELIFEQYDADVIVPLLKQIWWGFGLDRPEGRPVTKG